MPTERQLNESLRQQFEHPFLRDPTDPLYRGRLVRGYDVIVPPTPWDLQCTFGPSPLMAGVKELQAQEAFDAQEVMESCPRCRGSAHVLDDQGEPTSCPVCKGEGIIPSGIVVIKPAPRNEVQNL